VTGPDPERSLLDVAMQAARAAVEVIHDNRPDTLRVATKSSATDHVTHMDLASEDVIRDVIARSRRHDAVLGEEHGGEIDPDRVTWVVDPIDGTTNYLYDHPGYAVSIAAWAGDAPVVGVVADPTHSRTYWAARGSGSHCRANGPGSGDDLRLSIADPPPLDEMLVATGFGYDRKMRGLQGSVVASLLPRIRDVRRMGAAALDLCSVAAGRVEAYYEVGLSIWDLAAGWLVATEAGAAVEAIEGGPPRPGSVLVAHPERIGELRALLMDCGVAEVLRSG
jgi:myo-inositol-1(or 4)-monophosphatase